MEEGTPVTRHIGSKPDAEEQGDRMEVKLTQEQWDDIYNLVRDRKQEWSQASVIGIEWARPAAYEEFKKFDAILLAIRTQPGRTPVR